MAMCPSWMRGVTACGVTSAWSQRRANARPRDPVMPMTTIPSARATCTARVTLAERPLVVMATSTSPGDPSPSSWRANTSS